MNMRANEKQQLSQNFHNLALLFQEKNKLDSAFFYIHKAIALKGEIGDSGGRAFSNHALGTIQLTAGQFNEAIISFQESLEISTLFGFTPGLFYG
ncbi:MAG: tetratricopeptide repeat protein, partial [Flavobacteriales bacterium]|nr:tetratricopeptide repeat protein [Flavobacteriales bacterium]